MITIKQAIQDKLITQYRPRKCPNCWTLKKMQALYLMDNGKIYFVCRDCYHSCIWSVK